jgi:hypothetical protein
MIPIPHDEIRFHPHSFADPAGRLFWWNGQLYRGLCPDWAVLFKRLFCAGTLQRLVKQGLLIDTEPTDFRIDGYETVVRHRAVPFASYPEEWCPAMLKDAALTLLDLLSELAHFDLTLKDSHPWNLLFDRGRPLYVDLTSIIPIRDAQWRGYDEFCRFYQNPLILMAHGQERIARRLLFEYDGVLRPDVEALTRGATTPLSLAAIVGRFRKASHKDLSPSCQRQANRDSHSRSAKEAESAAANSLIACFQETKRQIEHIRLPAGSVRDDNNFSLSPAGRNCWTPTQQAVHEILDRLKPSSVLDIGSPDNGWYSRLVTACGSTALALGTDSKVLTKLYLDAHHQHLPLLPVVMEFTDPTPSRGLCSHWSVAASERLKCDMVLALANVQQYVFKRALNFDQFAAGLAAFSKRWVVAEFVLPAEQDLQNSSSRKIPWYNLENFAGALRKQFPSVTIVPDVAPGRALLMCEK